MHRSIASAVVALLVLGSSPSWGGPVARAEGKPRASKHVAPKSADKQASTGRRIVDTAAVKEAMGRGALIWDVRDDKAYQQGHLPGALNVGEIGKTLRKDADEDYIPLADIEKRLGDAGIDPTQEIIVYGDKGSPYAYFGLVTVEYLGGTKGRIYHGGLDDWKAAQLPVETAPAKGKPIALKLEVNTKVLVSTKEVLASLKKKNVQFLDVRTPGEYRGDDIRAIRGGHIPGAVHVAYEQNWVDPATPGKLAKRQAKNRDGMALKSTADLKALYSKLDPTKETVVYCQSGVRAAETAVVLKDLGFKDVKVYDSSWLGYGNTLDAPAEDEQFFNVGALNAKLAAMQRRIEQLEQALEASRAKPTR